MKLNELIDKLDLRVLSPAEDMEREVRGGYTSDLLSDVMGNAEADTVWITLQVHRNVVAVAALKEVAAVLLVHGAEPDGQTLIEGVARDYLLWLLRRELTPPDSMLDFFRSDTPLTDRVLSDQHSDLTACALAGAECVLEAYAYPRGEIYDLKLLLPELAMRLTEDEDTPALERAHALCASLGSEHFFTQLAPLTPRYDARDIFLATLTLYLREQTA